jgi:site-specific DNA-methyltransferase (adenine-specific)
MKPTWEDPRYNIRLFRGDCLRVLPELRSRADFLLADPCYGTTKATWDVRHNYAVLLPALADRLKPAAVQAWFACGKFTFEMAARLGKTFRYDLVWEKSNAVGFLDARRKPLRAHESILIACQRLAASTFHPVKTVACSPRPRGDASLGSRATTLYGKASWKRTWREDGRRFPRSVIFVPSEAKQRNQHPTKKPVALLEWLIETYTNPGDLVLDFCFGSGSTAVACINTGRRFVGCERDRTFFAQAVRRIKDHIALKDFN